MRTSKAGTNYSTKFEYGLVWRLKDIEKEIEQLKTEAKEIKEKLHLKTK